MKKTFAFLIIVFSNIVINAQIVSIPDANFKNYLLNNSSVNINSDTEIQVTEANAFTGTLFADNKNISDLTGIEDFINLTILHCFSNQLTNLNLSNSPNLIELNCSFNQLTSLNIMGNTALVNLFAGNNLLTSITLTSNTALKTLDIPNNQLSSLDVSSNPNLLIFKSSKNPITSLNINNSFSIQTFIVEGTQITSLDLSNHSDLDILWLDSNNLSILNIKNDSNIVLPFFRARGNPNLICIQVDDSSWSYNNWTAIDATSFFSTNCSVGINEITKNNFNVAIYPNPANSYFNLEITNQQPLEKLTLQIMDVTGKVVKQAAIRNTLNKVDVSNIPKGYYIIILKSVDSIVFANEVV
ncbi:MAG: hypothetical protein COA97_09585 [Flavobacteriales bacterium]|nr:MAG: hypothetical protein COA97_09585 [Flavobacteriales bacterium]